MGSVTRSIKRLFAHNDTVAIPLMRVLTPCVRGNGTKIIDIRIFDKHGLVDEMATSEEIRQDLQSFFRGLSGRSDLDTDVAAGLSQITFNVTYDNRQPDQSEIDRFRVNDYPVYLLTATPSINSTGADIISLLRSHRIPETIFVFTRQQTGQVQQHENIYQTIGDSWENKPDTLGYGIGGPYFIQRNQNICRKVGIIKMRGNMIVNLQFGDRRKKLVSVLKHELGHMFGMAHEPNTLMDKSYNVSINHDSYTPDQLWIMARALEILLQT